MAPSLWRLFARRWRIFPFAKRGQAPHPLARRRASRYVTTELHYRRGGSRENRTFEWRADRNR